MEKFYSKISCLLLLATMCFTTNAFAQLDLPRGSQKAKVSQRIGITDITIIYSRPSVNDRKFGVLLYLMV